MRLPRRITIYYKKSVKKYCSDNITDGDAFMNQRDSEYKVMYDTYLKWV